MKRLALKSALVAVMAVFVFGGVALATNQPYQSGSNIAVPAGEVVDRTLFTAGDVVTIAGTVNGDVFCAGKTVFVTGTVNGDVICAGQEVRISGVVNGSVRAAGQSVSIAGTVQRAISLAGQSVSVEPDAKIGGDAALAGSSVLVAGAVARDGLTAGESVTVTGSVARNLDAHTDSLQVAPGAVKGTVNQVKSPAPKQKTTAAAPLIGLNFLIFFMLAMFVTAMALVLIAPRQFHDLADEALAKPGVTLLMGLVLAFILPMALFFLAITAVGIPLAIFVALLWAGAFFLSGPVFAYIVGRRLLQDSRKPLVIMAVGSLIVLLLYLIPVINFFVGLAAYLMGMGALAGAASRILGKPKYTV